MFTSHSLAGALSTALSKRAVVVHDVRHIIADDVVLRGRLRTIRDHKLPAQVCGIVHEHTPVPILIQPESDALGRLPREWLVVLLVTR